MTDGAPVPALVVSKADAGVPVGAGSTIDYTITVNNIGNADATGVTVTDPIPANTSFTSAADGGVLDHGKVTWTGQDHRRPATASSCTSGARSPPASTPR